MNNRLIFFDSSYPPPVKGGKEKQAHNLALILNKKIYNVIALTTHRELSIRLSKYEGVYRISVSYLSKHLTWRAFSCPASIRQCYNLIASESL